MTAAGSEKVIIIGAGVAGLATAGLLAREGYEVTVLERHERTGGRAGVLERDGFRFDTGPSWYLMPQIFDHFFHLMGTCAAEQLDLVALDPGYRVFSEPEVSGEPAPFIDVPHGEAAVRKVFSGLEPGAGEALGQYLQSAREATDMAEKYFLYNPFRSARSLLTREVLQNLGRLAALLGTSLETHIARRFHHPVLRQILGYPSVFLGTHPAQAPAIYHLMSALDLDSGVLYPRGGFWALMQKLHALARAAGAKIITEANVTAITTKHRSRLGRKTRGITGVAWADRDGGANHLAADIVVSAADLHHTETQLLSAPDRSYPQRWWNKKQSGPGAVLTLLGVEGELPQLAHHSLFFTRDWEANFEAIFAKNPTVPDPMSLYVCRASATDSQVAPAGSEQLFILTPVPADAAIGHGGTDGGGAAQVEEISRRSIAQVAQWAGIADLNERITVRETIGPADFARDYHAWSAGMLGPGHTLGQSAMFRAQNASKKVAGLYYAGGSTAPGIGVPMCLISAELVLKHLHGDNSAGPLPVERA